MKNKKGFTLIELLAVIIILGVLMVIAVPAVTKYINDSRKSSYVSTAKSIASGVRNLIHSGALDLDDPDTTYYIDYGCIKVENASKSPYGDFVDGETYVIVTYDGNGYKYYWVSRDTTGQGVKEITSIEKLDEDDIVSDIKAGEIKTNIPIGNRNYTQIINSSGEKEAPQPADTANKVPEGGSNGNNTNDVTQLGNKICKRATSLHSFTCNEEWGCAYGSIDNGVTTEYGNLGTKGQLPQAGDAFDCDVNNDGTWDPETERFYYVTSNGDNSVLIYNANVINGTSVASSVDTNIDYDSSGENWHGPRDAYDELPSLTQWSNSQIIAPGSRQIINENGGNTTNLGEYTIETFIYLNKAARLLTVRDLVYSGCVDDVSNWGDFGIDHLNNCDFLVEKVGYFENNDTTGSGGYLLETPKSNFYDYICAVQGWRLISITYKSEPDANYGVRPVIEVLTSNIDY